MFSAGRLIASTLGRRFCREECILAAVSFMTDFEPALAQVLETLSSGKPTTVAELGATCGGPSKLLELLTFLAEVRTLETIG